MGQEPPPNCRATILRRFLFHQTYSATLGGDTASEIGAMAKHRWRIKVFHELPDEPLSSGMRNNMRECVVIMTNPTQKSKIFFSERLGPRSKGSGSSHRFPSISNIITVSSIRLRLLIFRRTTLSLSSPI
jgi:hypothetical protein